MHEVEMTAQPETAETTEAMVPFGKAVAPWWHTALVVLILLGISFAGGAESKKANFGTHHIPQYIATMGFEWLMLGLVWIGLRVRGVPMRTLMGEPHRGWRGLGRDLALAGIFWVMALVVLGCAAVVLHLIHPSAPTAQKAVVALAPSSLLDGVLWLLVCASAGICEELVFRGYLLRQFSSIRGKVWLGVLLSSLVFGASHGYEGWATMIMITLYGALFCVLMIKSKSLRPGMFAHFGHDFFVGLVVALLHSMHKI